MHSWPNKRLYLDITVAVVSLAYPFLVYFGLTRFSPLVVGIFLIVFLSLRVLLKQGRKRKPAEAGIFIFVILAVTILMFFNQLLAIKAYPVVVSLSMAAVFVFSLLYPPTIIEKIARLREPELDERGVQYTRKVTIAWVIFFLVNAAISTWTALFASLEVWTLYNGFISYILIGLMFLVELTVRQFVKRRKAG